MNKRVLKTVVIGLLTLLLAGCSAGGNLTKSQAAADTAWDYGAETYDDVDYEIGEVDDFDYDDDYDDDEAPEMPEMDDAVPGTGGALSAQPTSAETKKIVYTMDLSLQTTAFDDGVLKIPLHTEEFQGFVQDSYIEGTNMNERYYSRNARFTVRVPVERLDAFVDLLADEFHTVYQQKQSSDISGYYYDTKARLDSLRIQEERLLAMLETADELQYLLEVERELANVLYEIETMTSSLNHMDSSVNMSTVSIQLQEVNTYDDLQPTVKPVTFGDRVQETFGDSWASFVAFLQGLLLFFIYLVPFIPILIIVGVVVLLVVRRRRKRLLQVSEQDNPNDGESENPTEKE